MVQPMDTNDLGLLVLGVGILLVVVLVVIRRVVRKDRPPTVQEIAAHEEAVRALNDAMPKCVCGEQATEPAPHLRWNRGALDWLRTVFAAPPRFKRLIDPMTPPTLCKHHARVADSLLDDWLFRTRSRYSEMNAKVAIEAAAFEQEVLVKLLSESLTDSQKRAMRKSTTSPLRVVNTRTGTDDAPSE